jgi:hypothetical protein
MEKKELPVYALSVDKDGPKLPNKRPVIDHSGDRYGERGTDRHLRTHDLRSATQAAWPETGAAKGTRGHDGHRPYREAVRELVGVDRGRE